MNSRRERCRGRRNDAGTLPGERYRCLSRFFIEVRSTGTERRSRGQQGDGNEGIEF
ncbi:MAG: hypothetical protein IJV40_06065 [Oscillospiraceae bacterium]|nr:hypothetical protein [Oscillospiraceae bacterium]